MSHCPLDIPSWTANHWVSARLCSPAARPKSHSSVGLIDPSPLRLPRHHIRTATLMRQAARKDLCAASHTCNDWGGAGCARWRALTGLAIVALQAGGNTLRRPSSARAQRPGAAQRKASAPAPFAGAPTKQVPPDPALHFRPHGFPGKYVIDYLMCHRSTMCER